MKVSLWKKNENGWDNHESSQPTENDKVQLVLSFGAKELLEEQDVYGELRDKFPNAHIVMGSTAGEIYHDTVQENSMVAMALQLQKTRVQPARVNIGDYAGSYEAARALAEPLKQNGLRYILVISDGSLVNGDKLIKGFHDALGDEVLVTGGLAGDGTNFVSTQTGIDDKPGEGNIIAIGFYGDHIRVSHGSQGGWDSFGPERSITRSEGNVLYEIDDRNALELYKKYLGPEAEHLPGSALLFPLSVIVPGAAEPVVRTILSIDEENSTMTFAGNVPEGSRIRFMKANFDKLTAAAATAAHQTIQQDNLPDFSLLVSCVGRKIILGPRIEEEVEAVHERLGTHTLLGGFYSYGEISPFNKGGHCQLHNQTMTITSFYELS